MHFQTDFLLLSNCALYNPTSEAESNQLLSTFLEMQMFPRTHTAPLQLLCSWAQEDLGNQVLSGTVCALHQRIGAWQLTSQRGSPGPSSRLASIFPLWKSKTKHTKNENRLLLRST